MLKVGDVFTQNGKAYKVVGENASGLISERYEGPAVEKTDEVPAEEAPKKRSRKKAE